MTDLDKGKTVSLQELMVSTLAMAFKQKLMEERATYQKILNPTPQ